MNKNAIPVFLFLLLFPRVSVGGDAFSDGLEAERRGDPASAVELYRKALADRPDDGRAKAALRRAQNDLEHRRLKGEAEARRKAREESLVRKDEEKRLKEVRARRVDEGRRFLSDGKLLRAWDVFRRLSDENPAFRPADQGLEKAQKLLQQRIQRGEFPSPRHYAAAQGVVRFGEGRWLDAARFLEKALEGGPLPEDLAAARVAEYAAEARRRAFLPSAGNSLTPLITRSAPEDPTVSRETLDEAERTYREGLRLFGLDRPAEARESFKKTLALNPRHVEAREALERMEENSHEAR
jgi:tetratricopeptide (TPR) repeat protein